MVQFVNALYIYTNTESVSVNGKIKRLVALVAGRVCLSPDLLNPITTYVSMRNTIVPEPHSPYAVSS